MSPCTPRGQRRKRDTRTCTIRDNQATKDWFVLALSAVVQPDEQKRRDLFARFLDSLRRVMPEVEPTPCIGYDGGKVGKATGDWMAQQKAAEQDAADAS